MLGSEKYKRKQMGNKEYRKSRKEEKTITKSSCSSLWVMLGEEAHMKKVTSFIIELGGWDWNS